MPRLIVLSERTAVEWVLQHERMAFLGHVKTDAIRPGTPIALYVTRGAFHSPTRDEAQIIAIGRVASDVVTASVQIAGRSYEKSCSLILDARAPLREGLPFRPLVDRLEFISKKHAWAIYLRRTLVPISNDDFQVIRREFLAFLERTDKHL